MLTLAFASAVLLAMSAVPALADSPHFTKATASTDSKGNLVVTFKEAGLGNTATTEHITVSADASAEYGCFNRGGNHSSSCQQRNSNYASVRE
jgi:hypothetical protein